MEVQRTAPEAETGAARIASVYLTLVLVWGTTWMAIRISLPYLPPFFSLAVRFLVAGPVILLIMKLRGERIPWDLRHQPFFAGIGFLSFTVSYGVVYWAEQYITSGLAAVLFAVLPLFTGIVAHFLLRRQEPLRRRQLLGLAVGLAGVVVINASDLAQFNPLAPLAGILVLLSPLATAFASVITKRRVGDFTPMALAGMPMLYGGASHVVLWRLFEAGKPIRWSWQALAATGYLTLVGSVLTFWGYFWLMKRIEVTRLNLISYLFPLVALGVGFLGGETLTPLMLAGCLLVLAGVAVANRVRAA